MRNSWISLLYAFVVGLLALLFGGCNDFLDEKPYKGMVVPKKLDDFQVLLDNHAFVNGASSALLEALADNYYITFDAWQSLREEERLHHIWDPGAESPNAWNNLYRSVYVANVVLDGLASIGSDENRERFDRIKGTALFYRAFSYFTIAQLWCKPFSITADKDPGIPLRTTAAIETKSVRSTVQETYEKITIDLELASSLLPEEVEFATQPNRAAAFGALARTYLTMGYYEEALHYANLCLDRKDNLMDFNAIEVSTAPFRRFNPETVFYSFSNVILVSLSSGTTGRIAPELYHAYDDYDRRKSLFFQAHTGAGEGSYFFRGSYDGDFVPRGVFFGITTGEMYLIRAECEARLGNRSGALEALNTLLINRMDNRVEFVPLTIENSDLLLDRILWERRKELVYRGMRWIDARRLNVEGAGITFTRTFGDRTYTLPPSDPRWVLLIPQEVIENSEMLQNER